ncbi:MAG: rRNA maturation RNase YbeY [Deltaproteobacteria bacterium]|nr:rRNA maturation RNase YbeY [Deltaproteobacteria bacterium]
MLDVEIEGNDLSRPAARLLKRVAKEHLEILKQQGRELSISLVSDRTIRKLNREHRGKDKATDVLSFPQEEPKDALRATGPIGDVVISLHTAVRQADAGGWKVSLELKRLFAHGLLHCLGYDHETDADAKAMAAMEERVLGARGMVGDSLTQR